LISHISEQSLINTGGHIGYKQPNKQVPYNDKDLALN